MNAGGQYERIAGAQRGLIQAWLGQAAFGRRLSTHFRITIGAVLLRDTGLDIGAIERRGVRLALSWEPDGELRR